MVDAKTRVCCLLGDPVEHSLSQAMHNAAYAELGRYQDALVHLEQGVQMRANDPMAHLNLGIILSKLGRIDEARIEFRRAQALAPNDLAVRAQIESLTGNFTPP